MRKISAGLAVTTVGLIFSGISHAAVSKPIEIMASVASACTLDVAPLNFGTYTGAALNVNSELRVNCSRGQPYAVLMGAGKNSDPAGPRNMRDSAGNKLPYTLTYAGRDWGDNGATSSGGAPVTGVGKGRLERYSVEGHVRVLNAAPASGVYNDTVMVTLAF